MKKLFWLSIIMLSLFSVQISCSNVQKNESVKSERISSDTLELATRLLQDFVDDKKLAGISALINIDGETAYRKNFGYSQLDKKTPMKDDAIFRIYSMTKPVTAVALMTLFDEGKFALDDKVSKYIPEFEGAMVYNSETKTLESQKEEMTIRHLLTHTSGLTYGWDQKAYVDSLVRTSGASSWDGVLADKIKILAKLPLKHQPGTKYEYGLSIDVAGYLVEILSGKPLDKFMNERIFEPLKMDDTGFYVPKEKHSRLSSLNTITNDKIKESEGYMLKAFKTPVTFFSGGGGLVSTVDDYLSFCKMLLNGGELDGIRILQESTAELIVTNQLPDGVTYYENKGFGLAGDVHLKTGTYGWAGAASTKFWIDPKKDMITIFCTQLMPWDFSYADEFKKIVDKVLTD